MWNEINFFKRPLFILICFLFVFSCSMLPELKVNYKLPSEYGLLNGKKVVLIVKDNRSSEVFIAEGALKDFRNYSGDISYSVAKPDEPGFKVGLYKLIPMFRECFERRLKFLGLEVCDENVQGIPSITILLNEFTLDLVNRKWKAKIAYKARFISNGEGEKVQSINGQAERLKLLGQKEAGRVLGELLSDMINKLDIVHFFIKDTSKN